MERHEKLNQMLMPVDQAMEQGLTALKKANLYDPFKKSLWNTMTTAMRFNFKMMNDLAIYGTENVPLTGGLLLACNHQSWLDVQVITVSAPRQISWVAKSEFTDWPLLRHLIALTDSVFIDRKGGNSLESIARRLEQGTAVGIFPEGTIPGEEDIPRWDVDPETGLLRGKTGVVRLALAAGVPIVPVGVSGAGRAFPPEAYPRMQESPLPKPGRIEIRFGEPIHVGLRKGEELSYGQLRGMTDRVMRAISHLVDHSMNYEPISLPIHQKTEPTSLPRIPFSSKPLKTGQERAPMGVLVLHGFTSHIDCVADLREELDELGVPYRIPWLRGHGTHYKDLEGVTSDDWYEDAENTLLDLMKDCRKVVVVGLSMGGLVALDLAAHHRKDVEGVVAIAAAMKFKNPMTGMTKVLARAVPTWPSPKAYADKDLEKARNRNYPKFPTDAFASLFDYGFEVNNRLSFIKAPALIIHSKKDQVVHPVASELIYKRISSKDKELQWYEESGHEMLLDLEAKKVRTSVKAFIQRLMLEREERTEEVRDIPRTAQEVSTPTTVVDAPVKKAAPKKKATAKKAAPRKAAPKKKATPRNAAPKKKAAPRKAAPRKKATQKKAK